MKLTIRRSEASNIPEGRALVGHHYRYWLDDKEVTNNLVKLALTVGVDDVNKVVLVCRVDDVAVDVDALYELGIEIPDSIEAP